MTAVVLDNEFPAEDLGDLSLDGDRSGIRHPRDRSRLQQKDGMWVMALRTVRGYRAARGTDREGEDDDTGVHQAPRDRATPGRRRVWPCTQQF
jgi:hypothetical protein